MAMDSAVGRRRHHHTLMLSSTLLLPPLLLCLLLTTSHIFVLVTGVAAAAERIAAAVHVGVGRRCYGYGSSSSSSSSSSFFINNCVSGCRQSVDHRRKCQQRWQLLHGVAGIGSVRPRSVTSTSLSSTSSSSSRQQLSQQHQHHSSGRRWKGRRAKHSFLPPPTQSLSSIDEKAILSQLGYIPSNACRVSARSGELERMNNKGDADTCLAATPATTASAEMKDDTTTIADISADGYGRPIAIQCYPLLVQLISSSGEINNDVEGTAKRATVTTTQSSSPETTIITPFPTLYWLTCPHVSRAISELEREGYARVFRERLEQEEKMNIWRECHDEYASERWNSLSVEDQRRLLLPQQSPSLHYPIDCDDDTEESKKRESMRHILQYSGVAGTEYQHYYHEDEVEITMSSSSSGSSTSRKISPLPSVKCLHAHFAHYRSQVSSMNDDNNGAEGMAINIVGMWTHELLLNRFPEIVF